MAQPPAHSNVIQLLKKQKYHFIGNHSAVKSCRWLHETLVNDRPCYKQKFYGIKTHQCIQITPTTLYCTQQCLFCWRAQSSDFQTPWNELNTPTWDPPQEIVEKSIKAQQLILTGYNANPKTNRQKYKEAQTPKHAAISLTGEPTLYPHLGELIHTFHKKGFTTFLVSNGTIPSALAKLSEEPTQLYISLCAPDQRTYKHACRPQIPRGWQKLNETLSLLPSFKCPTVTRITSVNRLNMKNPKGYSRLIQKANPTYIEAKAYMHVGFSRLRLTYQNTPTHTQMKDFSQQLANETGYNLIDESPESRVVLLSRLQKPTKLGTS